jgi:hypothetical protein
VLTGLNQTSWQIASCAGPRPVDRACQLLSAVTERHPSRTTGSKPGSTHGSSLPDISPSQSNRLRRPQSRAGSCRSGRRQQASDISAISALTSRYGCNDPYPCADDWHAGMDSQPSIGEGERAACWFQASRVSERPQGRGRGRGRWKQTASPDPISTAAIESAMISVLRVLRLCQLTV